MNIPRPTNLWNSSVFRLYRNYGRQSLPYAAVATLIGAVSTSVSQLQQIIFGLIVETLGGQETGSAFPFAEAILPAGQQDRILFLVVGVLLIYIFTSIASTVSGYLWARVRQELIDTLRVESYNAVQRLTPKRFIQRDTGEYTSLVVRDTDKLGSLPRNFLSTGLSNIVKVGTMGTLLFALNWQFAILTLSTIPIYLWLIPKYSEVVKEMHTKENEAESKVIGRINASINGVLTVKSYVAEEQELDEIESKSSDWKDTILNNTLKRSVYSEAFSTAGQITNIIVVGVGAFWVINGPPLFLTEPLTLGEWTVFYTNSTLLLSPARRFKSYVSHFKKSQASADRVFALLDAGKSDNQSDKPDIGSVDGELRFDNVEFTYLFEDNSPLEIAENLSDDEEDEGEDDETDETEEDEFTLGPVSCTVQEGETIGIVGKTGCGKSTFIKLLVDFLQPDSGSVRVDGKDISEYNPRSLREHIGYVSQDPYLFNSTLRENIRYGVPSASDEDVRKAVKAASMEDVVDKLDDGLDAEVGKDGSRLSGGQKQRVALARALVLDPEILVLDEATSHVDNITENNIKKAIHSAEEDRTTLVIAHRLSTVRDADRLFVFDDGQIKEKGHHDELRDANGLYAELWQKHVGE